MALRHAQGRALISALGSDGKVLGIIIDEVHCISQWGGDFRTTYAELKELRAYVPPEVPIAGCSATICPGAMSEIEASLLIDPLKTFYLNLGNDRPNIKIMVQTINNEEDYSALDTILSYDTMTTANAIPKTVIFANTRNKVMEIWRHVSSHLPPGPLQEAVDYLHSVRSHGTKHKVIRSFRSTLR